MTRIVRDAVASLLVAAALAAAISLIWWVMFTRAARADGLQAPPPPPEISLPPPGSGVLPYTLPFRQGPPTHGCIRTAIQLAYATGNRNVGLAAIEACKVYAPVQFPTRYPPPMPLGGPPPG